MKKLCLVFLIILGVSFTGKVWAQDWNTYASLYTTYINFENSQIKDNGWSTTGYLAFKNSYIHSLELALSQTKINYKTESDLSQTDFTVLYSNTDQILKNHVFKVGFHYINTDDQLTDNGKVIYFKGLYYQPYSWNIGLEFAYSLYNSIDTVAKGTTSNKKKSSASVASNDLRVFQFSPRFGYFFAALGKRIYGESRFYFILLNDYVGSFDKNNFSFEQYFSTYIGLTDFKISAWIGKQVFAVKNEGFVVYNLSDEYLGGFSFEVGRKVTTKLRVALNLSQEWLKHSGFNDNVGQTVVTLSLGGSF
ncbi:hypothetical protein Thein_0140 [Thermodesulfatator indicus DSM 15286]|uniref:Uncharacterized protein n=1 Tax=Thermodesulfatator indicus (strain DSM 15286 / JCM 11887 / CIR29812) TaxID=667014 RepID=F8A8X8_THEID|nr:hypothetical protein [Thermodesulfatator indicus]AEH44025.1 hypothetical protein Thein_0140 [Thermodesulfatator indicus DSM 15286]